MFRLAFHSVDGSSICLFDYTRIFNSDLYIVWLFSLRMDHIFVVLVSILPDNFREHDIKDQGTSMDFPLHKNKQKLHSYRTYLNCFQPKNQQVINF